MGANTDIELAEHVEKLLARLGEIEDPSAREQAEELVCALIDMYRAALERLVRTLDQHGTSQDALRRATRDELVSSLLILHGLHPLTLAQRVADAVDRLQEAYGERFQLSILSAFPDRVRLRLMGNPGSAQAAIKDAIEQTVRAAAPDADVIEVEVVLPSQLLQVLRSGDIPCNAVPRS